MERKHRVIRMGYWIIYDWHNSRIILGNGYNNHNSVLGSKKIKKGEDIVEEVEYCKEHDWEEKSREKQGKVDIVISKCSICGIFMMDSEKRK